MSEPMKYTMSNDSISVFYKGKMVVVQKGTTNFVALRTALMEENWDAVPGNLTVSSSLQEWAKGKFTLVGNVFHYEGAAIPHDFNQRITTMAASGESPAAFFKFWERLQANPSWRSVHQLWPFLSKKGIPLTKDGKFLAYKSVRRDYKDHHSGQFDNSPGTTNEMPRNQISDDPTQACHEGFHVGSLEYANQFGTGDRRIVVCEIDPADVVCVPNDYSHGKMRVCKYKVIGNHNDQHMSSTVHDEDELPIVEAEVDNDPADVNEGLEAGEMDPPGYDLEKDPLLTDEERVEERKKKASAPPKVAVKKPAKAGPPPRKAHGKLDDMGLKDLMEESLDTLRKYATHNLQIIGASKIPGGKSALVSKILKTRK